MPGDGNDGINDIKTVMHCVQEQQRTPTLAAGVEGYADFRVGTDNAADQNTGCDADFSAGIGADIGDVSEGEEVHEEQSRSKSSQFRGVQRRRDRVQWLASITMNGKICRSSHLPYSLVRQRNCTCIRSQNFHGV